MHTSTPPPSSRPDSAAVNTESFLLRCPRFLRMMLRDRRAALGVAWNLALLAIGATVLGVSNKEEPCMPLRVWIVGHLLLCVIDFLCVILEFRRRIRRSFSSGSDDVAVEHFLESEENSITKHIVSAYGVLLCIWLIVGFYWVTAGGQSLKRDSPQLYWLCITILALHGVIVLICLAVALIGIAYCCCLPYIHAIFYAVTDQEGATMEEIDQLPKYKFRMIKEFKKEGDAQKSSRGMITECGSDSAAEHVIAIEDAQECCICLSAYDDGAELRELPCNHHFHCTCIDKWLLINATCPLCSFNILRIDNLHQEV